MPSFYFEQVLQTALNGIDQNITGPVLRLAGVILILSLLYAVYEAYSNGGDVRALGVAGIKYLVLGLVFLNYQQAFRSVNGMFNTVADFIYNTNGIGDCNPELAEFGERLYQPAGAIQLLDACHRSDLRAS